MAGATFPSPSRPGLEDPVLVLFYMPLRNTIFAKDNFYHLFNRGVSKRKIFLSSDDYHRFLDRLKEYKKEFAIRIHCFCLLPNHFHLLVEQTKNYSVSAFMHKFLLAYAMYFNKKYDNIGPIFQSRFKAKLIDKDEYLTHLSRYIHLQPLKHRKWEVGKLKLYPWSSYPIYLRRKNDDLVDCKVILAYFSKKDSVSDYRDFIESPLLESEVEKISSFLFGSD
jgi:REP element-mobilizing transposase RayT